MYPHEQQERKINTHPMCTELPACALGVTETQTYLQRRLLDTKVALYNGWYESEEAGDSYVRVVIPAVTHKAGHVYWQARDVTGKAFLRYQCPKGPRHEAIIKVAPLDPPRGSVVVEGPMDALAAAGEGYDGYALMGMQPSRATLLHLCLLLEERAEQPVIVLLDRDSMQHAITVCTFLCSQGYNTRVGLLPGPEKDLAECLPAKRKKLLDQNFQHLFRQKS